MFVLLRADTAAILRAQESMWPGVYEVKFEVKDTQGVACPEPQKVQVQVCTCEEAAVCAERDANVQTSKGAELGPAGIGLLFLGPLLLLRKYDVMLILMKGHVIKHLTPFSVLRTISRQVELSLSPVLGKAKARANNSKPRPKLGCTQCACLQKCEIILWDCILLVGHQY